MELSFKPFLLLDLESSWITNPRFGVANLSVPTGAAISQDPSTGGSAAAVASTCEVQFAGDAPAAEVHVLLLRVQRVHRRCFSVFEILN